MKASDYQVTTRDVLSQVLLDEGLSDLRDAIAEALVRRHLHPGDWSMHVEMFEPALDVPIDFTHADIDSTRITHPIIARAIDPEAQHLTYTSMRTPTGSPLHIVAAEGSNAGGVVLDHAGQEVAVIYDWRMKGLDGSGAAGDELAAMEKAWRQAVDGGAAADEASGPAIVVYRLNDLPPELTAAIPADAPVRDCLFWVSRAPVSGELFQEHPEPDIEYVNEGLTIAKDMVILLTRSARLAELLRPEEVPNGGVVRGGRHEFGFHTQPGDATAGWLRTHDYRLLGVAELFSTLRMVRPTEDGDLFGTIQYRSLVVNPDTRSELELTSSGIGALDVADSSFEHFELIAGPKTAELRGADLPAGAVTDVSL